MQTLSAAAPRYLIARYTPDLMRGEQHNIGVILWTPEGIAARFIGVHPGGRGSIAGCHIPPYVTSQSSYRQWIDYWLAQLDSGPIASLVDGGLVDQSSLDYLDALKSTSNGNFTIDDGGFLTNELSGGELADAVDYLFATLVRSRENELEAQDDDGADIQPALKNVCYQLLKQSKLISKATLYRPHSVKITDASGIVSSHRFDFAVADEKGQLPYHLYQRVPLLGREGEVQKSVYSAAWMFSSVVRSKFIDYDHGAALILATPNQLDDLNIKSKLAELSSVTRIFNLYTQKDDLLKEFRALAGR